MRCGGLGLRTALNEASSHPISNGCSRSPTPQNQPTTAPDSEFWFASLARLRERLNGS